MRKFAWWICCAALAAASISLHAQACSDLSNAAQAKVSRYLAQKYRLPQGATLTLKSNTLLPGTCLRELTFGADWPTITISVLLSPDGHYAFPGYFDLSQPPNAGPPITVAATPRAAAPASAPLAPASFAALEATPAPTLGPKNAPVTIVEFSDFECPFCKRLAETLRTNVMPASNGRVRLIYRMYPLPMHPWAERAAEMADCVAIQNVDVFWKLHDFLFGNQASLNPANLDAQVDAFLNKQPAIRLDSFRTCMSTHAMKARVDEDVAAGTRVGVHGTPTIFVNGVPMSGARPADQLDALIARQATSRGAVGPN